jgi:hypothetical protein
MQTMNRFVVVCAVIVACGCKSRDESAEPVDVEALPPDTARVADEPSVGDPGAEAPAADVDAEAGEGAGAAAGQASGNETGTTERDLSAELRAAVGSPSDCLKDYRPSTPMTIRVSISALVRPTGMIIEPSASGKGLSANDQRCIEQRVGDITLLPLSGQASAPVTTYVDIDYQPAEVEEYDVGGPEPKLDDVVEPLPKKEPIQPSGIRVEGPAPEPIEGPKGVPIQGPKGVPVEGPKPEPIEGYEVDQDAERWTE